LPSETAAAPRWNGADAAHWWPKRREQDLRNHAAQLRRKHTNALQMNEFEVARRQASLHPKRPVTPEVAGSSPVAPVFEVPARGDFFFAGFREPAVLGQQ
jgi:hypothetical protein